MTNKVARVVLATAILSPLSFITGIYGINTAQAACGDSAVSGVNWQDCRKRNLIMTDFDFTEANFSRSDLSSSDLRRTNLTKAVFFKANLVRASFKGSTAIEANFIGVTASRTDFSESDLSNSNFEKSEIIRSDFSGSNLSNSNMTKSDLLRAEFTGANLSGVDFSYSSLARADFRGAKLDENILLRDTYLYRTRLEGVDVSNLSGIEQWQINMSCGDSDTKLPDGISIPAAWPCDESDD